MPKLPQLIFAGLAAISEAVFWYLTGAASASEFGTIQFLAGISLMTFFVFIGLSFLFSSVSWILFAVFAGALPILFSLDDVSTSIGIIIILSVLSLIPAWLIKREIGIRRNFSVWYNLYRGFPLFLTLLSLSLALYFYSSEKAQTFEEIIPQSLFEKALGAAGKISLINSFLPFNIPNPNKTVNEALIEQIRLRSGEDLTKYSVVEREIILSEARNILARNLEVKNIDGNAKVGTIFYRESIKLLEEKFESYRMYLPLAFALAVFAAFRTSFIFAGWLAVALCWIIYKILLYTRVVELTKREVPHEYIEFNK
ncbi:hypothetical protein HYT00_02495 [Candidatus Giovannonibacteria bacterium]|nr:hypothetical protein [Candidatus Giovannonibacteria bacterium]